MVPAHERVHPKKARVPNRGVLAVRVAGEVEKGVLIEMGVGRFVEPLAVLTRDQHGQRSAIAFDEEPLA
jgi:hypothetical protein